MQLMTKSTVLFDLGNTLVGYYKSSEFLPVLEACVGSSCDYLSRKGFYVDPRAAFDHACTFNYEREDLAVWPIEERLKAIFSVDDRVNGLCRAFMQPIFETARLDPHAVPVLKRLREDGLKVGIISNTPWGSPSSLWRKELNRHGLLDVTDIVVFCVDVGWRKPHKAIFEYTLNELGVRPEEAVFVGDDAKWDVYGAQQAGMTPVLIDPSANETMPNVTTIRTLNELHAHI